jgi:erythromycin esterase
MSTGTAEWIKQRAHRISTLDPSASLDDLEPLRAPMASTQIVGLGESTHGAHEQFALKQRMVRLLVSELGFRSLVLEEDWTKGMEIDRYVVGGQGDVRAIVADAGVPWRTEEVLETIEWLRRFNVSHRSDPVRFMGADIVAVRQLAYDAVSDYVQQHAPDRAAELKGHFEPIYPRGPIFQHIQSYRSVQDKQPLVEHARQAYDLLSHVTPADGHELALQHARAIVGFYEYHAQHAVALRDERMAENTIWWQRHTGHKVIFWAANVHTANSPKLTISYPPFPPATQATAGSKLRQEYGASYLSVGFVFDHGAVNAGFAPPAAHTVGRPQPDFVEAGLSNAAPAMDSFFLDLHARGRERNGWLTQPAKTRVIGPAYDAKNDAEYWMADGSPAEWFDVEDPRTPSGTPGSRAPQLILEHRDTRVSTIDLFSGQWVLFAGARGKAWCDASSRVSADQSFELRCFLNGADRDLHDVDNRWSTVYGVGQEGTVLIRPDGFIAWRSGDVSDPEAALRSAFERLGFRRVTTARRM